MHAATHTYAVLQISPAAYREIRTALATAGYEDQFHERRNGEIIDMHGIALQEGLTVTTRDKPALLPDGYEKKVSLIHGPSLCTEGTP